MKKQKKYTDYYMEECSCGKQVCGSTAKQTRHNFAMHLKAKHNIEYESGVNYQITKLDEGIVVKIGEEVIQNE